MYSANLTAFLRVPGLSEGREGVMVVGATPLYPQNPAPPYPKSCQIVRIQKSPLKSRVCGPPILTAYSDSPTWPYTQCTN